MLTISFQFSRKIVWPIKGLSVYFHFNQSTNHVWNESLLNYTLSPLLSLRWRMKGAEYRFCLLGNLTQTHLKQLENKAGWDAIKWENIKKSDYKCFVRLTLWLQQWERVVKRGFFLSQLYCHPFHLFLAASFRINRNTKLLQTWYPLHSCQAHLLFFSIHCPVLFWQTLFSLPEIPFYWPISNSS